jgi:hypothetical protein
LRLRSADPFRQMIVEDVLIAAVVSIDTGQRRKDGGR